MSQRARILKAKEKGSPAENVLRFVQPRYFSPVLCEAANAYDPQSARGGVEFAGVFCGKSDKPRAMAPWKSRVRPAGSPDPPASDRAAGELGGVLKAAEGFGPVHRAAAFKRRIGFCARVSIFAPG